MVVEYLPESAPWPISLPPEPPRDRLLEARDGNDWTVQWRWRMFGIVGGWYGTHEYNGDHFWDWSEIVEYCIRDETTLTSYPIPAVERLDELT